MEEHVNKIDELTKTFFSAVYKDLRDNLKEWCEEVIQQYNVMIDLIESDGTGSDIFHQTFEIYTARCKLAKNEAIIQRMVNEFNSYTRTKRRES